MQAFLKNTTLTTLIEKPFQLEKEIQTLFEKNLETIDNLKFLSSEYQIEDYCIDTLAYETQNNSFVIIKYTSEADSNIVDQGIAYINLLLKNKFDLFLLYTESCDPNLQAKQIEWSKSKVIFVSTAFTSAQIESANSSDLAIDLWEIKQFENNIVLINRIKTSKPTPSSTKQVQSTINPVINKTTNTDITIDKVANEDIVYDEKSHLVNKPDNIIELYKCFKHEILALSDKLKIVPKKKTINFIQGEVTIVSITVLNSKLKIIINEKKGILYDPKNLTRDISNVGSWGTGDYEIRVEDTSNLEYIISLIKQILYKPYSDKSTANPIINKSDNTDITTDKIANETVIYDEAYHLINKPDEIVELYERFKHAILSLSNNLEIIPYKVTLKFRQDKVNIISIALTNTSLKIFINAKKGMLYDPKNLSRANMGHMATGDYELIVKDTSNLEYIMSLIKQILYKPYSDKSTENQIINKSDSTDITIDKVANDTVVYDEEYHLINKPDEIVELYERFKHAILSLSNNLEIIPYKVTLKFRQDKVNIISIALTNTSLKIFINAKKGMLYDPKNLSRANMGHMATGDYELIVKDTSNLEYIISLIKQILYKPYRDKSTANQVINDLANIAITANENVVYSSDPSIKQDTDSSIGKVTNENIAISKVDDIAFTDNEKSNLVDKPDTTIELYKSFRNAILSLSDRLELYVNKEYLNFCQDKATIVSINVTNRSLNIIINAKSGIILNDPKNITRDLSHVRYQKTGAYHLLESDTSNLEYIMSLIKQIL